MVNLARFLSWVVVMSTTASCSNREVLQHKTSLPPQTVDTRHSNLRQSAGPDTRMPMPPKELAPSRCGKSVTLTEIHPDPKRVKDRFGEFIEVYNDSNSRVDLTGWRLSDGDRDSHIIAAASALVVEAHSFAVLGSSADKAINGGIDVDYEYTNFRLSNHSDRVRLEDPCGKVVFDLSYPQPTGWPKLRSGRSVELTTAPSKKGVARWRLATKRIRSGDRATPGTARWYRKRTRRSKTDKTLKKGPVTN
jgi:hypothetical protein